MNEERRKRLLQIGSAAAFLAIVAVAVAVVITQSQSDGGDTELEDVATVNRELQGIPQSGMTLGRDDAPVTLVEFGDLQCPACKGFAEGIVPEVIASKVRGGEAKLEFRNFAILGDDSVSAGAAAVAAGQQGRGWYFVDLFYRNQGLEGSGYVTDEFLTEIAKGAGVPDIARWNQDRKDQTGSLREVQRSSEEAERLGMTGTPSFAVGGPATDGLEVLGTPGSAGALEEAIEGAD
ncbi:MAG: thioredoxin domain-containing protein [Solirubrobacterales bacterium]